MFKKIYEEDGSRVECARNYEGYLDSEHRALGVKSSVNKTTGSIDKKMGGAGRVEINKVSIRNSKARKNSVTGGGGKKRAKKERTAVLSNSFNQPSLQFSMPISGSYSEMANTPLPPGANYATLEKGGGAAAEPCRTDSPGSTVIGKSSGKGLRKVTKFTEMNSIKEIGDLQLEGITHEEHGGSKRSPSNKYLLQGAKSTRNL